MDAFQTNFIFGFIAGFAVATIGGAILNRINIARNGMMAPDRPMGVPTQRTPRSVMAQAAQAARQCLFWSAILVLFVIGALFALYLLLY